MSFIAESRRNNLWFGTELAMQWFPTPNRGADVSPQGWSEGGTLLSGGGYQLGSFGSHKNYIFEWPRSSSREVAQKMKSYYDGTYGRGLIYFQDPLTFDTNVLPARWADPSMSLGVEGGSLVYGVDPVSIPTSSWQQNNLPVLSAFYDVSTLPVGWRGKEHAVFIPIPEGYSLDLRSVHSQSGSGRVSVRVQSPSGALGITSPLFANSTTAPVNLSGISTFVGSSSVAGVWLFVNRLTPIAGSVTLTGIVARLRKSTSEWTSSWPSAEWIGGQGHSGCRFVQPPTYIENTGVGGGQVGFAASFREVGSWAFG